MQLLWHTAMKSQVFLAGPTKWLISCTKIRISNSFVGMVFGRKGRGFPFIVKSMVWQLGVIAAEGQRRWLLCSYPDWKMGGLKFHNIDDPLNGFSCVVNGFALKENFWNWMKMLERSLSRDMFKSFLSSDYDINKPHHKQPQKYWMLQELLKIVIL